MNTQVERGAWTTDIVMKGTQVECSYKSGLLSSFVCLSDWNVLLRPTYCS